MFPDAKKSDPFIDASCPIQKGGRFAPVVPTSCPIKRRPLRGRSCSQQLFPVVHRVTFLRRRRPLWGRSCCGRSCFQLFKRDSLFIPVVQKRLIIYYCFQFKKTAAAFMFLRSNCRPLHLCRLPKKSGRFASVVVLSCPIIIVTHFQMMSVAPINSKMACF